MDVECPNCNSTKIFKATYFRKDNVIVDGIRCQYVHPRYECLNCLHKFDTVPTGSIKIQAELRM